MSSFEIFNNSTFADYLAECYPGYQSRTIQTGDSEVRIISFQKKRFNYALSMPFGLYSPVNNHDNLSLLMGELKVQRFDSIVINIGPENRIPDEEVTRLSALHQYKLIKRTCHVFECNSDLSLIDRFNATRKKHIKRYLKAGKVNVFHTKDPKYFEQYFSLYQDSANRWGSQTVYPKDFITNLCRVPGIYMWVAEFDNKIISAMICMYHEDTVFDWLAASYLNDEYKSLYAAVAVQYEVFKHAQENGYRFVNMGASEGLNGVSNYKDSWNTSIKTTYSLVNETLMFSMLKRLHNFSSKITG